MPRTGNQEKDANHSATWTLASLVSWMKEAASRVCAFAVPAWACKKQIQPNPQCLQLRESKMWTDAFPAYTWATLVMSQDLLVRICKLIRLVRSSVEGRLGVWSCKTDAGYCKTFKTFIIPVEDSLMFLADRKATVSRGSLEQRIAEMMCQDPCYVSAKDHASSHADDKIICTAQQAVYHLTICRLARNIPKRFRCGAAYPKTFQVFSQGQGADQGGLCKLGTSCFNPRGSSWFWHEVVHEDLECVIRFRVTAEDAKCLQDTLWMALANVATLIAVQRMSFFRQAWKEAGKGHTRCHARMLNDDLGRMIAGFLLKELSKEDTVYLASLTAKAGPSCIATVLDILHLSQV